MRRGSNAKAISATSVRNWKKKYYYVFMYNTYIIQVVYKFMGIWVYDHVIKHDLSFQIWKLLRKYEKLKY